MNKQFGRYERSNSDLEQNISGSNQIVDSQPGEMYAY